MARSKTIDLWDALEDIKSDLESDIAEVEEDKHALMDPIQEEYGDWSSFEEEADESAVRSVENAFDDLEEEEVEYRTQIQALETKVEQVEEDWGDTHLQISELMVEQGGKIQDMTGQKISNGVEDVFEAAEGAAMTELLRMCIDSGPDGAPNDPGKYPVMIGTLIQKPIAELSGMAADDLGKSSAREWMETSNS